jgi:hypothetical protein
MLAFPASLAITYMEQSVLTFVLMAPSSTSKQKNVKPVRTNAGHALVMMLWPIATNACLDFSILKMDATRPAQIFTMEMSLLRLALVNSYH